LTERRKITMAEGTFGTVINCMDGRTQQPANRFLSERFGVTWIDTVTEPGPIKILADGAPAALLDSIRARLRISIEAHGSRKVAVVAHHDCAGNPEDEDIQRIQLDKSMKVVRGWFPGVEVIGLWITPETGEWIAREIL